MALGVGLFLIAIGAILAFAVNAHPSGVDLYTVGWILIGVGFAGVLLSLLFWSTWLGPGYLSARRHAPHHDVAQPPEPPEL
jgi:hypothetical protein